jgi:DNA mismatch repair protein MutS
VIRRATAYLGTLEAERATPSPQVQLDLVVPPPPADDDLRDAIERLDPDGLSPRDALAALYELKKLAER